MEHRIKRLLLRLGVRPNLDGFYQIAKVIEVYVNQLNENEMPRICEIYQQVADEFQISAKKIERNIRTAVSCCFKDNENICNQLSVKKCDKMSNSHFISIVAWKIINEEVY